MTADLDALWCAAIDPDAPRIADPRVTSVPVRECGEQLVDATGLLPTRPAAGQRAELGPASTLVRRGVLDRLLEASRRLDGSAIALVEGLRPTTRQAAEFDAECRRLATAHPDWSAAALAREAAVFVAPADAGAPHLSGGAVDICVLDAEGHELDLGTPVNGFLGQDDVACYTGCPDVSAAARERRRRLVSAMTAAGFVNYPTEWWHWSYGDRWWAWTTGADTAPYGPCHRRQGVYQPSDRSSRSRIEGRTP